MANETENKQETVGCTGDCQKCGIYQHAFCASQMCFTSFPLLDVIVSKLDEVKAELAELKAERELALPKLNKKTTKTQDYGLQQ